MSQPNKTIQRIALKEITLFFASPVAYVFLAAFAAVTLFVFFWGEAFFARNIADVRPLFEWMPILLIFLSATLTMRLWSEERRTGTLEYVFTQSVPLWHFVLGKFIACLVLLAIALLITLPLPLTVAYLGELDWGPVFAGYLATLLMGAAYLSIGLFVSARSDNQIVSMIVASTISGLFYLLGTTTITDFFGNQAGEWLRWLGTGSRFDAITRGVIDLRDLYYYLSIVVVFIVLNTLVLEKQRWSKGLAKYSIDKTNNKTKINKTKRHHHHVWYLVSGLLIANVLTANLWLGQLTSWRVDVTEGDQYSISNATQQYLNQLQEPLLLRGYFSSKTHPLLAPLVTQLRDLIREYKIVGNGKVRVEFIDPQTAPELEEEANQKYGIQPVPFQVADRYQSSIVSSYFNVLVQYGDEYQVLAFGDLIEIGADSDTNISVQLRNPEYDLTRAIKKVLNNYQAAGNLFDTVKGDLQFTGYFSADDRLPEQLVALKSEIITAVNDVVTQSNGRLQIINRDPDANNGEIGQQIAQDYGFEPMATSLFDQERFYFYMTLGKGDQLVQIPLADMQIDTFKRTLQATIKRFASGFSRARCATATSTFWTKRRRAF
jgi:ABC-2 type transport system permease protein